MEGHDHRRGEPGTVGHVTMLTVGATREMKLHGAGDDSQRKPVIPSLLNPEIVAMGGNRMLFVGMERQGAQDDPNGPTLMQEWVVEVLVAPPAEMANTSHRSPA